MSVSRESRYNYSATILVADAAGFLVEKPHLDIRPQLVNIVHPDNVEFSPSGNDTWSRIGWRKLGNGRRWWIIADYSQILDPFSELKPETKYKYVTQLSVNVPATTAITSITVVNAKKVKRGDVLRVEDLDTGNLVSFECFVLAVNETTNVVTISPITTPAGGVPFLLSRVSRVYKEQLRLIIPSANRAFFEALNFGNPLNVLSE